MTTIDEISQARYPEPSATSSYIIRLCRSSLVHWQHFFICEFIMELGCLAGLPQVDGENWVIFGLHYVFAKRNFSRY